ncbi:MAG: hypothetical protein IKB34_07515 [Clostridia bacterium]|nr:hypothetical protein [Clostridia bacterium]
MTTSENKKRSSKRTRASSAKNKRSDSARVGAGGFIALIVSLFVLTAILFPERTGTVGAALHTVAFGLLGAVGAYVLPLSVCGVLFFRVKFVKNRVSGRKTAFALTFALALTAVVHLISEGVPDMSVGFSAAFADFWGRGKEGYGGGAFGGALALIFGKLLGHIPATVICIAVSALALSLTLGYSGWGIWASVAGYLCIDTAPASAKRKAPPRAETQRRNPTAISSVGASAALTKSIADIRPTVVSDNVVGPRDERAEAEEAPVLRGVTVGDIIGVADTDVRRDGEGEAAAVAVFDAPMLAVNGALNGGEATEEAVKSPEDRLLRVELSENAFVDEESEDGELSPTPGENANAEFADPFEGGFRPEKESRRYRGIRLIGKRRAAVAAPENAETDDAPLRASDAPLRASDAPLRAFDAPFRASDAPFRASDASEESPRVPTGGRDNGSENKVDDGIKRWVKGQKYIYPPTTLLEERSEKKSVSEEEVQEVADRILRKLASFKVSARLVGYSIGPSITRYELAPGEGVRVSKISELVNDISLELASDGVRIEAPIPGKAAVGIEVPNKKTSIVSFRSLAENPSFMKAKSKITVCVGQNVMGTPVFMDIDDMPHVLIAGQTKSGKSVAINCMLLSLFFRVSPDEVKLILIDPKRVELNIYGKMPHLIAPVVDEPAKAAAVLSWAVKEMERRYDLMEHYGARNRDEYKKLSARDPESEDFPQIVIVIDELADLMLQVKEHVEPLINRLAAKARACGIHLLIGTQRPSVDVLTGLVKANIPARISFKVAEQVDSRTIIGTKGAEKLLGKGDMLYQPTGSARTRVQGAFVDGEEISRVVGFIVENNGEAAYDPHVLEQIEEEAQAMLPAKKRGNVITDDEVTGPDKKLDPLFNDAVEIAVRSQSVATSSLQRYLEVGYARAAKLIDSMEKKGIVGPPNGSMPRRVLMDMQ